MSRIIASAGLKKLDVEMRHKIYDEFSSDGNLKIIIIATLGVSYLAFLSYLAEFRWIINPVYIVLFSGYFIASFLINRRRLRTLNAPADYVRSVTLSWITFLLGFAVVLVASIIGRSY